MASVSSINLLKHSCREVVGQKVGGGFLMAHGLPEERVVNVVDLAHGCGA